MKIRSAQLQDLPQVLQLFRRFYADTHCVEIDGLPVDDAATLQSFTALVVNRLGNIILVTEDSDEVVGVLALQAGPQFFCKEIVVTELFWYVTPELGRGVSSALLNRAEAWAREIRATHVLMGLHRSSPAVARLSYEKRGYIETQTAYMKRL